MYLPPVWSSQTIQLNNQTWRYVKSVVNPNANNDQSNMTLSTTTKLKLCAVVTHAIPPTVSSLSNLLQNLNINGNRNGTNLSGANNHSNSSLVLYPNDILNWLDIFGRASCDDDSSDVSSSSSRWLSFVESLSGGLSPNIQNQSILDTDWSRAAEFGQLFRQEISLMGQIETFKTRSYLPDYHNPSSPSLGLSMFTLVSTSLSSSQSQL